MSKLRNKKYGAGTIPPLDETGIAPDPIVFFSKWMRDAVNAGLDEPEAMVLSTAGRDGSVSGRVVLLKGIESGSFFFFSNYDSRKGMHLEENKQAALTFPWLGLQRQVRIEGVVRKTGRKASLAYFNSRPYENRISACISPQSCEIPDRMFLESMRSGLILDLGGKSPECPDNWGGYRLRPERIEFWQGREYRLHDRILFTRRGRSWTVARLAP